MSNILIKAKVQLITYETPTGDLAQQYATSEKRISFSDARKILLERDIEFKEILKVKYIDTQFTIPVEQFEANLIKN